MQSIIVIILLTPAGLMALYTIILLCEYAAKPPQGTFGSIIEMVGNSFLWIFGLSFYIAVFVGVIWLIKQVWIAV